MPEKLTIAEILEKNPDLNLNELEQGRELRESLKESGAGAKRRYGVYPLDRRRVRVDDDIDSDPRVVYLRRCSR